MTILGAASSLALFNGVSEILSTPFIVPVAGCVTGLGIVLGGIYSGIRTREMQSQERLAAIAAGRPVPPTLEELAIIHGQPFKGAGRASDGRASRRAGIVLIFVALGLVAFFALLSAILQVRGLLSGVAVGLVPMMIGVGFLLDARLNARDFARDNDRSASAGEAGGMVD